jgi:hypothetical protein
MEQAQDCVMVGFGISGVETLGSAITVLVNYSYFTLL